MNEDKFSILHFPPPAPGFTPSNLSFFVVGIGASAGGIEALIRFFEAMPSENGMAFVVVIHLSPTHKSNIAQILQEKTKMPVLQVTQTVAIQPNHVYIIPPTKDLLMNDGSLQIVEAVRPHGRHVTIDVFFRTLAEVHRERAVGVILSGAGSDGAVGIARIKEKGGMTFAQLPDDAEYDSMPHCAIQTGLVDWVLPVVDMPQKLLDLFHNASSLQLPQARNLDQSLAASNIEAQAAEAEVALREIMKMLRIRTGHDFQHYKRATVLRRIERRLQVTGLPNVIAYRNHLEADPDEARALLQDMLISVTNFFRDRAAFEALERDVIPRIFQEAPAAEQIRAWSVGCATGEEAYSLAMLLVDQNALSSAPRPIQVFASDIDERAIDIARRGTYPNSIVTDVTPVRLRQYFDKLDVSYGVKREIREKILFAIHNILRDPPFSRLHLITCRNLLIYLDRDVQKKVFEIFHYALAPAGFLFLGSAESVDALPDLFVPVDKKYRIYQATNLRSGSHSLPTLPAMDLSPVLKPVKQQPERRHAAPQEIYRQFLEDYAAPSILIDQHHAVVYATRSAGRFLHHPGGEPSTDILTTAHPDLQLELRAALFQASQSHQEIVTRYLPMQEAGKMAFIRMVIRPARDQHAGTGMFFLAFEESTDPDKAVLVMEPAADNAIAVHLEKELMQTKAQLRSVIEQYETALEELKGANEELQASNEELRSTAEELETSKEELQSINEELNTVNQELKIKVDETARTNDDLQNFLAATEIPTIFVDRNMRIKRFSKPCTKLFNLIESDVSRSLLDITYRLDYPDLEDDIENVFRTLRPNEREVRGTSGGQWYIARLLPYRTAEDRIEGLILSFIDISTRKAAEENLRSSEQRMQVISVSTRDYAIATMDANGIITSWNSGAEHVFGYSEVEMIGCSAGRLYTQEDQAMEVFQDELRRARAEGRSEDDRWHLRKNGARIFCSGITSLLAEQSPGGYIKIARDVTKLKWVHEQQDAKLTWERQERIRAEEAARVRDEFFAVLSHELKQPLNLIQLTAEMLSRLPDAASTPAILRGTATIKHMVEGQARIIDDLMDLSRLHTGRLSLTHTQFELRDSVAQVVRLMGADAEKKGVALRIDTGDDEVLIYGDAVRIEQIAWNLVSNALKFTPTDGSVHVRVGREDEAAIIEVTDTGKGISPELMPYIFDMFRQANSSTTRQFGGLGIGLALVKELVASHGGRVEAHSAGEGCGAHFRVCLPLSLSQLTKPPVMPDAEYTLRGKRVLLVDDAPETLEALSILLGMEGANVTTASNGADAIQIADAANDKFDLIVSDLGMPGMDGHQLLAELRQRPATAATAAIALSGFTRPADIRRALETGFATHVCKPVELDQFIKTASRLSV
ncbi:chemotaxis protein CheB [Noviherbaspirillum galbum]|uniref:PAS domain S-box protein n=1 Tax=Noviherbaspirillum galbum TaxID=2709383 RepID=A0A6B3SR42_9BURK|nr:chemotaxis protein CheB [Noviherbaspirillum galbum]NEX61795.1 PAS domain S-box protein [Noviherbaspirillum galbum]